jgi:hypothetical protein
VKRCTGHCCRRFPLPASLDDIRRRRNADVCPPDEKWIQDGDKLAEMLIPLDGGTYSNGQPAFYFTCKHHDIASGDCTNYEQRPAMCRDYPYGRPCEHTDCTAENRGVPRDVVVLRVARETVPDR